MREIQKRAIVAVRDHPRWTIAGIGGVVAIAAALAPGLLWLFGFIVWRGEYETYKHQQAVKDQWHRVGHARAKVDRYNDALDLLRARYSSDQFIELYREKLSEASGELQKAGDCAQQLTEGAERCKQ